MIRDVTLLLIFLMVTFTIAGCDFLKNNEPDPQPLPTPRVVADEDYTVTDSGLKYYDFVVGDGAVADSGSFVSVHYHGWFTNGVLFDSSILRGRPIEFLLGRGVVIDGWEEGLMGMQVGGERQLVIPPELGYGATGSNSIPPNATLVFEVFLLGVQ